MKYYPLLIASSLLCMASFANADVSAKNLYFGIEGGIDSLNVKQKSTSVIPTLLAPVTEKYTFENGDTGPIIGIHLGYEQPLGPRFFTAIELAANHNWSDTNTNLENPMGFSGRQVKFKQNIDNDYSLSLMPGFKVMNSKAYLKFGAHQGKYKYRSSGNTTFDLGFNGSFSEWLTGYSAGVGIKFDITSRLVLRLEYNHVDYDSVTKTSSDAFTGHTTTSKFSPESNTVMLGLDIHLPV